MFGSFATEGYHACKRLASKDGVLLFLSKSGGHIQSLLPIEWDLVLAELFRALVIVRRKQSP